MKFTKSKIQMWFSPVKKACTSFGFGMHEIFFEAGKIDAILIFEEKGVCYSGSLQFKNPDLLLPCK